MFTRACTHCPFDTNRLYNHRKRPYPNDAYRRDLFYILVDFVSHYIIIYNYKKVELFDNFHAKSANYTRI